MIELPQFDQVNTDDLAVLPQINSPTAVTVSEIKKVFAGLGKLLLDPEADDNDPNKFQENRWVIATQESLPDKTIVSRTYADLIFDEDAFDFDFITDGDTEDFGSDTYWRVIHRFTEKEFFSNNSPELQNFRIWELSYHKWQQEIIYLHEEIASLQWDRPEITVVRDSLTTGGGTTGSPGVTTYSCTSTPAATNPPGETGDSAVFSRGSAETLECYREASIPIPFSVTFDVGEALGGFVESDGSITHILLKSTPAPRLGVLQAGDVIVPNGTEGNPIKYSQRYVEVYFDLPSKTEPTYVRLRRYGVENFRISIPFERDLEPEFCHHELTTPRLTQTALGTPTMYKPPNEYNFPDNFSNDGPPSPLQGFGARLGSGGSVSTNG